MTKTILIAQSAGFCFGVKRAIAIAHETAAGSANGSAPIHSLGPIIHNPQAVAELETKGVKVVDSPSEVSCGTVIIRSHGVTRSDRALLDDRGVTVVDATCPFVTKAQEHASLLSREGYAVIVVGDADHPEVRSIVSYIQSGVPVLTTVEEIRAAVGIRKAGVVAQTTQSLEHLLDFVSEALRKFPEVRVFNTICNATALRQKESMAVASRADSMIVLGGYNSANTRRLAEICREINVRTHHVETAGEIDATMLEGVSRVGVTAGASTPQWIIEEVLRTLRDRWKGEEVVVEPVGDPSRISAKREADSLTDHL